MFGKISISVSVILSVVGLVAPPAFAQSTFSVGSVNVSAADIGATELTGAITLTITSGTSVEAPFTIKYSALITNNSKNEIFVQGTGGLSGIPWAPTLDRTTNSILINVPAGGVPGNRIDIAGVRVALAGQNYTSVTASITGSAGGNALAAGQSTPTVIGSILQPLAVDLDVAPPLQWTNGQVVNPSTYFYVTEGFLSAFTDALGQYGQTVPTRIRVNPFPSVPAGVKLTFSSTATSIETGATLTTLSKVPETVPRSDGSTDVTYAFSGNRLSASTLESFPISVTVSVDPDTRATGTVTFQAALVPIGIAVPNKSFPSTDIPRFTERLVPDESDLITGATKLAIPFRIKSDGTYTGLAITNPQNFRVDITLTAYDSAGNIITGTGITNPVNLTLPRRGQLAKVATEIFGTGFNTASSGTIIVDGKTPLLEGFYLVGDAAGGSRLDGSTADISPFEISTLPAVFHQDPSTYNFLEIYNPGTTAAVVLLRLYDTNGMEISTATLPAIKPGGSLSRDATQIFSNLDLSAFSGGYISCRSNVAVVARETFGNARDSNVLAAQSGLQRRSIPIAHFAQGGGYITEINLINGSVAVNAEITLTALDNGGTQLAIPGNPAQITIKPGAQLIQGMQDLFPALGSSLTTGSLQMDVKQSSSGPYVTVPPVLGSIRFSSADGYSSASLPTVLPASSDFVYSQVAQALGYYTGIALLNTNTTMTSVTLDVYKADGTWVGVSTITLLPSQKVSRLLYEFIPTTLGQVGGYVHIHASQPIISFALFGTDDGKSLSAIPPQPVD